MKNNKTNPPALIFSNIHYMSIGIFTSSGGKIFAGTGGYQDEFVPVQLFIQ